MGEKKDSGSKDADNFGAEFGTDRRLAHRQASQAALTSRAGDDRASGKTPVPTVAAPQVTISAKSNKQTELDPEFEEFRRELVASAVPGTIDPRLRRAAVAQQQAARQLVPDPGMMATSLGQDLMREAANITDRDTRNFGAEFGGINPITADVSPVLALTRNAMNQGSGIASLQDQGIAPDAAIDEVFLPPASGTTTPATPEPDLGFEDVDDDDNFFPVTNEAQDITALNPNFLSRLPLVGDALYQGQINQLQQFASIPGSKYDYSTGGGSAQVGQGTLTLSPSGIVTYDGPKDASYTGPFANLGNPPDKPEKDAGDQCPPGFQLIDGVCRPMFDIAGPATPPPAPGSNFQMAPTSGFPTSFAPMTQATPVSLPDPFVLSPTGAAIGRRV